MSRPLRSGAFEAARPRAVDGSAVKHAPARRRLARHAPKRPAMVVDCRARRAGRRLRPSLRGVDRSRQQTTAPEAWFELALSRKLEQPWCWRQQFPVLLVTAERRRMGSSGHAVPPPARPASLSRTAGIAGGITDDVARVLTQSIVAPAPPIRESGGSMRSVAELRR
jgi:hypothetical protein